MNYRCDEEGLFCPECGLPPHACQCRQIKAIVKEMFHLQGKPYFEPLGEEWQLEGTDQELISLN